MKNESYGSCFVAKTSAPEVVCRADLEPERKLVIAEHNLSVNTYLWQWKEIKNLTVWRDVDGPPQQGKDPLFYWYPRQTVLELSQQYWSSEEGDEQVLKRAAALQHHMSQQSWQMLTQDRRLSTVQRELIAMKQEQLIDDDC